MSSFTTRSGPSWAAGFVSCLIVAEVALAKPEVPPVIAVEEEQLDEITAPQAGKALQDTIWIADWNFDSPDGDCTSAGWEVYDNRIVNDGSNYWGVTTDYAGFGGGVITNKAAALREHDLCWVSDGYGNATQQGNFWDYSIVLKYSGSAATLSFKFISDSEPDYDFVTVESDSLGLSEARVDYSVNPAGALGGNDPSSFRDELLSVDGDNSAGVVVAPIALPDYGPGIHEVYIRFRADFAVSHQDGGWPSAFGAGLVVDDIVVTGGTAYTEDFEGVLNSNVQLLNTAPATPFGSWARLYKHITDNERCTENTTCAWLWTDPTLIAYFPDMEFGPGGAVIRSWLDNMIVSPWTSLATTSSALGTVLSFRRFVGSRIFQGGVFHEWRVRGKTSIENTDTSVPGDSIDCVSRWSSAPIIGMPTLFTWATPRFDVSSFIPAGSHEVQFAYRVSDLRYLTGAPAPATLNPGPGPFLDRVRIGRHSLSGPLFDIGLDPRFQGSDNFASTPNAITPGVHYSPSTDRFGTADFRQGADKAVNLVSTQVVSGDSVTTNVLDVRAAGGIRSVKWYGAITNGPHAGKAPTPYSVGANGFFEVTADTCRTPTGAVVANRWFVSLDDTYLRGGDELLYFWHATDAGGGASSAPAGIGAALPASVAAAEAATKGLFAVNVLPSIDWAPEYLARIAADAHGDLAPTPAELAASSQRNCVLYYQHTTGNRRSGPANATSFMRTLNTLGYDGDYDIYDPQGYGNTNNQLASRATIEQCTGYQLIIEDDGRSNLTPNIPDGGNRDNEKVRQATFYRNWMDAGLGSEAGRATLWILGESTAAESPTNPLFTSYCGMGAVMQDQALSLNPEVAGSTSFTFAPASCIADFASDVFFLNGGCPLFRNYDGYSAGGTAIATHRYRGGTTLGPAAILMNSRPATNANAILMGFGWSDIRDASCVPPGCPAPIIPPAKLLMAKILSCVLSPGCQEPHDPTTVPGDGGVGAPAVSALHPNVPNPFNPTTAIAFDLARTGHVRLEVFDVAGRIVRTLVDGEMPAGRGHQVSWNGLDTAGVRASTGLYFYRLTAGDLTATRKMIVLK